MIISTGLRLWSEFRLHRNRLAVDDFLMIWAMMVGVGGCIAGLCMTQYGFARHRVALTDEQFMAAQKSYYIFLSFSVLSVWSNKLPVLALYY
ncbi:hypothetical protein BDW74DRAFT_179991 [Aspergillus multicolor]|uniref:uncharacterized protein n=1 Tax=Aspergillus multicolor TaxID=41759 RepID=UPI003CCD33E8